MTHNDLATIEMSNGSRTLHMEWDDPGLAVMGLMQLSRDELLERLRSGDLPQPPLARLLNIAVVEAEPGRMVLSLTPDERHVNFLGVVGGGVVTTVLDIATWGAVHLSLEDKSLVTTVSMNTNFLRGVSHAQGTLHAIARTVHVGRTTAVAEARLVDAADKTYATATASFVRMGG
ncbi:PaaI family thioesterase [Nocardia sp. NPDC023852]|uniref:PaaI family thioesterase n=1 Tax=unclassified Nocardia TaxID=2637762 RepID=UPI0034031AEE|nr:PaaI family thioesterase [Nocardia sp. NBC_00881]